MPDATHEIMQMPEGTRLDTKEVGPFKKGPFRIAMAAGIPLVSIVIRNAEMIGGRNATTMNPGSVDVAVLPPISTADGSSTTSRPTSRWSVSSTSTPSPAGPPKATDGAGGPSAERIGSAGQRVRVAEGLEEHVGAAVHEEGLADDVARIGREEEDDRSGDLVGVGSAADRDRNHVEAGLRLG